MSTIRIRSLVALVLVSAAMAACNRPPDEPPRRQDTPAAIPAPSDSVPPGTPSGTPGGGTGAALPGSAPATVAGTNALEDADRSFVSTAMGGGLAEMEAGRLVAGKTANQDVKRFAEMLQQDHSKANTELARIASLKGLTPDARIPAPMQTHLDELARLSGAELDQTFLQHFGASAHDDTIAQFERQAAQGKDPDLRAFATQTLPDLRKHLEMSRQLQQGTRTAAGSGAR